MIDITKAIELNGKWLSGKGGERADLSDANLSGANLIGANLKFYQSGLWMAYIQPEYIRIGCQYFPVTEWEGFSDKEISKMHPLALSYWRENKDIVLSIAHSFKKEINA